MAYTDPTNNEIQGSEGARPISFGPEVRWRFSAAGAFWAVLGAVGLFAGVGVVGHLLGLVMIGYSIYLFRGGRFSFIVW